VLNTEQSAVSARVITEASGAIRKLNLEPSVVRRVIGVRGGVISVEHGVLRARRKTPSVEHGAIRGQHGAQSEESGAIRKPHKTSSVEHRVIGVRCEA